MAKVRAPAGKIEQIDLAVVVAVGRERDTGLAERFAPQDIVGHVHAAVEIVVTQKGHS